MSSPAPAWNGLDDPALYAAIKRHLRDGLNRDQIAEAVGLGEYRLRELRGRAASELLAEAVLEGDDARKTRERADVETGRILVEGEGRRVEMEGHTGRASTGIVTSVIASDDDLLRRSQLDPSVYEIDRTKRQVKHANWDTAAKVKKVESFTEAGEPVYGQNIEVNTLHKFEFDFRPIGGELGEEAEVDRAERLYTAWFDRLNAIEPPVSLPGTEAPVAYFLGIGDEQIGKPKTDETIAGIKRAVLGHLERVKGLRAAGRNIPKLIIGKGGDGAENVVGNYRGQTYETAGWGDYTRQLDAYEDLCLWVVETLAPHFEEVEIWFVPSNHGEWVRAGGKDPVTSYRDNADIKIGLTLKKFLPRIPGLSHVRVIIAGEELSDDDLKGQLTLQHDPTDAAWCVLRDVCGTLTYMSHGYLEGGQPQKKVTTSREGKMVGTIERQMLARRKELADLKLVVVFHYHHRYEIEFQGVTVQGEPACEAFGSSEYMSRFGVWSYPGVTGRLVGSAMGPRGHGEYTIL